MTKGTTSPAFLFTALLLVVCVVVLVAESGSVSGAIFLLPFTLGPLLVSLTIAAFSLRRPSQITLLIGSVLYAIWFSYVYLSAFYSNLDAQSSVALLFVGIYSLPVMIPVWVIALALKRRNRFKGE